MTNSLLWWTPVQAWIFIGMACGYIAFYWLVREVEGPRVAGWLSLVVAGLIAMFAVMPSVLAQNNTTVIEVEPANLTLLVLFAFIAIFIALGAMVHRLFIALIGLIMLIMGVTIVADFTTEDWLPGFVSLLGLLVFMMGVVMTAKEPGGL